MVTLLRKRLGALLVASAVTGALACAIYWLGDELRASRLQALLISGFARELRFRVEPGASDAIRFPGAGPYDERLGYHQLPRFVERLQNERFAVTAQARMSPRLLAIADGGLFPTYREKDQAGLELLDCRSESLFSARYPERVYERFETVPSLLVDALVFIENRDLLDAQRPQLNPALDWGRLAKAAVDRTLHAVNHAHPGAGGSTLATQIEKYRHSPHGRTDSVAEKLRQMASASLRAYAGGQDTLARRRQIVVDYLNTVPLVRATASARSTAWATACGSGTGVISPSSTACWPTAATRCTSRPKRSGVRRWPSSRRCRCWSRSAGRRTTSARAMRRWLS